MWTSVIVDVLIALFPNFLGEGSDETNYNRRTSKRLRDVIGKGFFFGLNWQVSPPRGRVLPNISYIGMCRPKGYGF